MTLRRTLLLLPALLSVAVLGACTPPPSLDPVPTVAPSPFICDGVSRHSAELILGGDVEKHEFGSWKASRFECTINLVGGGFREGTIRILRNELARIGEDTDEFLIQYMGGPDVTRPMTADALGRGFTSRQDDVTQAGAVWACQGYASTVGVDGVDIEGRDAEEDAANLLRSLLPRACDDAHVPPATS